MMCTRFWLFGYMSKPICTRFDVGYRLLVIMKVIKTEGVKM